MNVIERLRRPRTEQEQRKYAVYAVCNGIVSLVCLLDALPHRERFYLIFAAGIFTINSLYFIVLSTDYELDLIKRK